MTPVEQTPERVDYAKVEIRRERDRLLAETDWMVIKAMESGQTLATAWAEYRQALRDLPQIATIELNRFGYLDWTKVEWPQKPEVTE